MRKQGYAYTKSVAFFICILFVLLPISVMAEQPQSTAVRVGWYEDVYSITEKNGDRSGYGYEYEQAVAGYTGWSYEYVPGGWDELFEKIRNGEIDFMGGVSYTEERAQNMLFSDLPMGEEKYYIYADITNTGISASNLETLNNKRIGVIKGSVLETFFYEWEAKHNIHAQPVFVENFDDTMQKFKNHELDGAISTGTQQWVNFGLSAIVTIGSSDIYFVFSKKRADLKADLDRAMRKMEYDKPFYTDELYKKYLSNESVAYLSNEEQDWLAQHQAIRVGWLNNDEGISAVDPVTGKPTGVLNDYIAVAQNSLENQTLKFELVEFASQAEQIQAMKDDKIDMIFHVSQNPYYAEQNGFALSNTVFSFNMTAVTGKEYFDENAENSVAVPKDDIALKWHIAYCYPDWEIIECDSLKDAEKAVRNGEADCLLAKSEQLEKYISDKKLHSVLLTEPGDSSFAVNRGDTILLSILNKTLKNISSSTLTGAVAMYANTRQKVKAIDFVKDNPFMVSAVFTVIFLFVLMIVLGLLKKSRAAEARATEAMSEAKKANAAKTTFLNNMSHDIRTPMNAIVGVANLMVYDKDDSEKMGVYVHKIQVASRHLLSLINDILDMSKIESGEVTLSLGPISLADQVGQVESIIRPQAEERGQKFTIGVHEISHEYLVGDAVRLRQVFINLLSNAVKYTPYGGEISLKLTELPCELPDNAKFCISVADTGYGMTPEFVRHIFEPFTRAENSTTNKIQGTGLGMAITKNIVNLMGGTITVQSEPNKGSCFEVVITLAIDKNAKIKLPFHNVLLISDNADFVQNAYAAFSETEITLNAVKTETEAETVLKENHVDIVLLNRSLQGQKDYIHRLRAKAKQARFFYCCDHEQQKELTGIAENYDIDGVLIRPFFLSNLLRSADGLYSNAFTQKNEKESILRGMRFLCAEDNELNAEILTAILDMKGASCVIYPDGKKLAEAFASVQQGDYDAILMDVQMPVMNGLEATKVIRQGDNPLGKTIPIIAMTANAFSSDVQDCFDSGMDAHVSKPLDIVVLERTLKTLKKQKNMQRSR